MAESSGERKLAAILSADVAGYSKLMGDDERATVRTLTDYREVFRDHIARHKGRVVDSPGDNLMADFASPVEAVAAAAEIQRELARRNAQLADHRRMEFRIGINLGDVLEKDGALFGDGVNIAARLEALAEPGGICVSGGAYEQVRDRTDFGFQDIGEHEVKNIARPVRAYRVLTDGAPQAAPRPPRSQRNALIAVAAVFVAVMAGVAVWQVTRPPPTTTPAQPDTVAEPEDPVLALPTGPSIAVLPFDNISGDTGQGYFVDGITEEIITGLTRFPDLFVIARFSTFQYKGKSVDVRQIGTELGVQYVLEGSVRRAVNTIRVTAQLIDAITGNHVWADTYERELTAENIFGVQDEITNHIVASIADTTAGAIFQEKLREARSKPPASLDAYDCVLLARAYYNMASPRAHLLARDCLERTVVAESDYAAAWTGLAVVYLGEYQFGFNPRPEDPPALDRALEAAKRAVSLDSADPEAHSVLGSIYFHTDQIDRFVIEAEEVLRLSPNNATIIAEIGNYLNNIGEGERGVALVKKSMTLNPNHPGWINVTIFNNHYWNSRYEEALVAILKWNNPDFYWWHANTAAAYGQLGRLEEAKPHVAKLLELNPEFPERAREELRIWIPIDDFVEHLLDGMRKAGIDIRDEPPASD